MTLAETLAWLVDIPSETGDEGRIATAIAERLLPTFGQGVARIGNSLIVGHRGGRPLISMFGHTDTVPSQGQGPASVVADRMVGLGTSDMKSGLAVMIHLLEDEGVRSSSLFDVVGVFYAAEEGPHEGNELEAVFDHAGWLDESELGIILEPTDLNLELGCQGVINAQITFRGTAAHSARPWLGESAITKAAGWLQTMGARQPEPILVGGLEFKEVMSVTRASSGIANNVIPATFECNVNYRFAPNKTLDQATAKLAEALAEVDEFVVTDAAPAGAVEASNHHVERMAIITGAEERPKQGWTDAARLSQRGIPAINYGPGEVAMAHKVDESVAVANLDAAFGYLRRFLTEE